MKFGFAVVEKKTTSFIVQNVKRNHIIYQDLSETIIIFNFLESYKLITQGHTTYMNSVLYLLKQGRIQCVSNYPQNA